MYDFHSIVTAYGFTRESYDFESTIIGFDYDIRFSLFDTKTIFDTDRSRIYRQWDKPSAFLRCELVTLAGDVDTAVRFFYRHWLTEIRYERPVREIIDVQQCDDSAIIHALTISQSNAMTMLFNIKRGML